MLNPLIVSSMETRQPGMFVKADLVVNSSENTIVIPKDIIMSRNRNQIVYVVDKGIASERIITSTGNRYWAAR